MYLRHADKYTSTLASGYTSGGTSLSVTSAGSGDAQLPLEGLYFVVVKAEGSNTREVFMCSSRSGTTLQVIGAQAGTSASNHASGAVITGTVLTGDAMRTLAPLDIMINRLPGEKGDYQLQYATVADGATIEILPEVTGAGYIDWMFMGIPAGERLILTIDGDVVYDDIARYFFAGEYSDSQPAHTKGKWIWWNNSGAGISCTIPIPFRESIKIELENNSGSSKTLFTHVTYVLTETPFPYAHRLKCVTAFSSAEAPDAVFELADISGLNPGRIVGVYWNYDGFPGSFSPRTAALEGDWRIYLDGSGSPSIRTPGGEDFFGASNYFQDFAAGDVFKGGDIGITIKTSNTWAAYRFFVQDPIFFSNGFKITWNVGDTSQVACAGTARIRTTVWYYEES